MYNIVVIGWRIEWKFIREFMKSLQLVKKLKSHTHTHTHTQRLHVEFESLFL
jgi:hypothetical protein